jgi:hypothetical protein
MCVGRHPLVIWSWRAKRMPLLLTGIREQGKGETFLKGQCHEIFCFRFFAVINIPQAPESNIRVNLKFFENSLRFLQVKVHHRCHCYRQQICRRCQRHRWQIVTGINDTCDKKWEQYETANTLKWTWRKNFFYLLTILPKGVKTLKQNS